VSKPTKRKRVTIRPGSRPNVRVIEADSDGSFAAYRVPEKGLPARLFDKTAALVSFLIEPRSNLRVGSDVYSLNERRDLFKRIRGPKAKT